MNLDHDIIEYKQLSESDKYIIGYTQLSIADIRLSITRLRTNIK